MMPLPQGHSRPQGSPDERHATLLQRASAMRDHILSLPADKFGGKPWDLVAAMESYASGSDIPVMLGGPKRELVRNLLAALDPKPKLILEFGTFLGTSALTWAAILLDLHAGDASSVKVYSFEPDLDLANVARDMAELAGLEQTILILDGPGAESLKQLHAEGLVGPGQVDVVFLDHCKASYLPDLKLCEALKVLRKGTVVAADDADSRGAPDYLEYVRKGGSGQSGAVRYRSKSMETENNGSGANLVEVTEVVEV